MKGLYLVFLLLSGANCRIFCRFEYKNQNTLECLPIDNQMNSLSLIEAKEDDNILIVELQKCQIVNVIGHPFQKVKNTTFLDLSNNLIDAIGDAVFEDVPHIEVLKLSRNVIEQLTAKTFKPLAKLKELDLSYNALIIDEYSPPFLINQPELRILDVSRNYDVYFNIVMKNLNIKTLRMTKTGLKFFDEPIDMSKITYLFLAENEIKELPDGVFDSFKNMLELDLSVNKLVFKSISENMFSSNSLLENLNISYNNLESFDDNRFLSKNIELKSLDLSHNVIASILISNLFESNKKLVYLDLSHNQIDQIHSSALKSLEKLEFLDLSNNRLPAIPNRLLERNEKLTTLLLNGNRLKSFAPQAVSSNYMLRKLSLADNQLESLSVNVVHKLSALISLDLSNNRLTTIAAQFSRYPNLLNLDLSCNLIHVLHKKFLTTSNGAFLVNLHGNPLKCNCIFDILDDKYKMGDYHRTGFSDGRSLTCIPGNSTNCEGDLKIDPDLLKEWKITIMQSSKLCKFQS